MREIKEDFKQLDSLFRREEALSLESRAVIATAYELVGTKNPSACEVAIRRYRKGEHRLTTCRQMYISESNYYRLLTCFLQLAKDELAQ